MTLKEAAQRALDVLEANKRSHYYCEDSWYSCPKHPEGCANESAGDECDCGADKANAQIDKAITTLRAALGADAMQRLTDEQQMIERGTKAWADIPNATEWVEDLRGNQSASLTIEEIMCLPYYKTCAQLVEKVYTPMLIYFAKDVEYALNKRK